MATLHEIFELNFEGQLEDGWTSVTILATDEEAELFIKTFGSKFVSKPIESVNFTDILKMKQSGMNFYRSYVEERGLNTKEITDPMDIKEHLGWEEYFWAKGLLEATQLGIQQYKNREQVREKTSC